MNKPVIRFLVLAVVILALMLGASLLSSAVTLTRSDLAWKFGVFSAAVSLAFGPLIDLHALLHFGTRPLSYFDALAATIISVAALPLLPQVFAYFAHLTSGVMLTGRAVRALIAFGSVCVAVGAFGAFRLTKRCREKKLKVGIRR